MIQIITTPSLKPTADFIKIPKMNTFVQRIALLAIRNTNGLWKGIYIYIAILYCTLHVIPCFIEVYLTKTDIHKSNY